MLHSSFEVRRNFIIHLGKSLHKFGTPAFRLEAHLENVAGTLGLDGYFLVTPTSMTFVLWTPEDAQEHTHVLRVKPGEIDLGKLAQTNQLVAQVTEQDISLDQAIIKLKQIHDADNNYSALATMLGFVASGGAFAMLMFASWNSIVCAALLSTISFAFAHWAERSRRIAEIVEPISALLCAFCAVLLSAFIPDLNIPIVTLSAIIIFIPGLALTLGLSELAARELISGTARVMDAIMVLFKLYFGAVLGMALGDLVVGLNNVPSLGLTPWWVSWIGVLLLSLGLSVVFKMRAKDVVWGALSGVIAFAASHAAALMLGDSLGTFIGALVVGIYANLYSRFSHAPASVVQLQGLVLLVPGSKAFISLNTMVLGENIAAIPNIGSQTFLIFMSIVAGTLFANLALPQRSTL